MQHETNTGHGRNTHYIICDVMGWDATIQTCCGRCITILGTFDSEWWGSCIILRRQVLLAWHFFPSNNH